MAEPQRKESSSSESSSSPAPKRDLLGVVLVLIAVVNLAALAGLGYFLQRMWVRLQEVQRQAMRPTTEAEPAKPSLGKELTPKALGLLYPLDSFLVNIASDQGAKYLQVQMELELSDPAVEEEINKKKAAVRDSVIVFLSSRNFKELREATGLKKVRADLIKVLNGLLSSGQIKEIYFTQFHFN